MHLSNSTTQLVMKNFELFYYKGVTVIQKQIVTETHPEGLAENVVEHVR